MKLLLVLACVGLGCASPDLELSSEEQATWNGGPEAPGEVIPVEGEAPPSPFDPDWEGPDSGAPVNQGEPSEGGAAGGGGGGGSGEPSGGPRPWPGPQPARKDCTEVEEPIECINCCEYNYFEVDGWKCNQLPWLEYMACWNAAMVVMAHCIHDCPESPGIRTGAGGLPGTLHP